MKRLIHAAAITVVVTSVLVWTDAAPTAQRQGMRPGGPGPGGREGGPPIAALDQPGVTPAQIQRMFDAWALVQAQEALKLEDQKYLPFLARYKALQDVRRQSQNERNRLHVELRRLVNDAASDENQIKERLKSLLDAEAREQTEIRKAYDGVDAVLEIRQQAKFRLFEEQMERLKIEMITKARQANRLQRKSQ